MKTLSYSFLSQLYPGCYENRQENRLIEGKTARCLCTLLISCSVDLFLFVILCTQ